MAAHFYLVKFYNTTMLNGFGEQDCTTLQSTEPESHQTAEIGFLFPLFYLQMG